MTYELVLYTDAGARPNPGFCGWGIHGYKFTQEEPKKGSGLSDQVITAKGYIAKSVYNERKQNDPEFNIKPVTVHSFIDGHGTFSFSTTNNVGELTAATRAIEYALQQQDVTHLRIITDSEYVFRGTNEFVSKWEANNWKRGDGSPIANSDIWKRHLLMIKTLEQRNIGLEIDWIKGHSGFLGNEISNKLATLGVIKSRNYMTINEINSVPAEGYWKYKVNRHPFISHRRLYFNTLLDFQIPGQYYLGEHGKDDEMLGKKSSDGAFAFVCLSNPDPVLEMIRQHQSALANNEDNFVMTRLDYVYTPDNHRDLTTYGTYALNKSNAFRLDLFGLNDEPITRELRPPKLAFRAIEALSELSERLTEYMENNPKYTATDITSCFFDTKTVVKKKETINHLVLKPELVVGITAIDIQGQFKRDEKLVAVPLKLIFSIDLPSRNSIKHMEDMDPKIELISWKESDKSFRYATVFRTKEDVAIYAGVYTNFQMFKD